MTNANTEFLVVEYKKEVAKMREREATDLEIQSMLEFVEQLTHWRGDVDREPLINALRVTSCSPCQCLAGHPGQGLWQGANAEHQRSNSDEARHRHDR